MEYTLYKKDNSLGMYGYQDIDPVALEVAQKFDLSNEAFNLYNYLCRGEFLLKRGDGDMMFNPASKGIGWRHDDMWAHKTLKKLRRAKLVEGGRTVWASEYSLHELLSGGICCSVHKVRKTLGLPYGWWYKGDFSSFNYGYTTTVKDKILTINYGVHTKVWDLNNQFYKNYRCKLIDEIYNSFIRMVNVTKGEPMIQIKGRKEINQYLETRCSKYEKFHGLKDFEFQNTFDKICIEVVFSGCMDGFVGSHTENRGGIREDDLNTYGFSMSEQPLPPHLPYEQRRLK